MAKAIAHTYSISAEFRSRLTVSFLLASVGLALIYGWNIYHIISHTVALERLETQTTLLAGAVDSLDAQYLTLSDKITPDALASHGMSQGQVSEYIDRNPSFGRVAMTGHEL